MASPLEVGKATALLAAASTERNRLKRHLLVGAALREILSGEPVIVGGTAEEYWTADDYHQTDLDLCASITPESRNRLIRAGFRQEGRHWLRDDIAVAVEFPDSRIDGDFSKTVLVTVAGGAARVIGIDDLYIDRLRQATVREEQEGVEFHSALAVAAGCFDVIDWPYVRLRIREISESPREGQVGVAMRKLDSKIRRRVRKSVDD